MLQRIGAAFGNILVHHLDDLVLAAANVVDGEVLRHMAEPGADPRLGLPHLRQFPQTQETFLRDVFGHLRVKAELIGNAMHDREILIHDIAPGAAVAPRCALHQGGVIGDHALVRTDVARGNSNRHLTYISFNARRGICRRRPGVSL